MSQVWHDDLPSLFLGRHFGAIFVLLDHEFEPPQAVFSSPKSTANGRPGWIADEIEIAREE
jgi:hypothetical protein